MSLAQLRRYLIPGIVFQSVVIGGGYGTGREIVEFFLSQGPMRGLASMALTVLIFSLVCAVSYEFARSHEVYDYHSFFRVLIGPFAPLYELAWFVFMLIVLSVVTAAVGAIFRDTFGLPYWGGVAGTGVLTLALIFYGTETIKRAFAVWTAILVAVFALTLLWALVKLGPNIHVAFTHASELGGQRAPPRNWAVAGIAYAGYNLSLIPALLYTVKNEVHTRREAITAGVLAGPIAMFPALMFFVAMSGLYPSILPAAVPSNTLLTALGSRPLQIAFQVVLIGTLIATSTGMVQSVNARLGFESGRPGVPTHGSQATAAHPGESTPGGHRARQGSIPVLVALGWIGVGAFFAKFGLISLIARGYGTVTWVFVAVYVVPVLTLGLWRLRTGK